MADSSESHYLKLVRLQLNTSGTAADLCENEVLRYDVLYILRFHVLILGFYSHSLLPSKYARPQIQIGLDADLSEAFETDQ